MDIRYACLRERYMRAITRCRLCRADAAITLIRCQPLRYVDVRHHTLSMLIRLRLDATPAASYRRFLPLTSYARRYAADAAAAR